MIRRGASLLLILLIAVATVPCGVSRAAEPPAAEAFIIDELVGRAPAENPELQAACAEVEAVRARVLQAGLRPNPMLDVGFQKSVTGPDNNVTAGVSLPLDLNRRQAGRLGVSERELTLKQAQVAERERMLRAEVRLKAGELLAARRNLRITEELLTANRQALGLVGERVRRGGTPALDENLMWVEVNRLDATREALEGQVEVLRLQLSPLLGLEPDAPLSVRGELRSVPVQLSREEGLRQALTARPDLLAAQAEAARQRLMLLGLTRKQVQALWSVSQALATPALIDGVITERAANPGQVVTMGEVPFTVTDLSEVWAVGDLYEQDFPHVRIGSDATLTTLAYPGLTRQGRITYIDPRVDPQTRTAKVRMEVSNPEGRLRLGMYVTVTFSTPSRERVVVVPRAAVQTIGERPVVFVTVPDEAGKFLQRRVELGPLAGESYPVRKGVQPGEVVVTEGSFFLRAESVRNAPGS